MLYLSRIDNFQVFEKLKKKMRLGKYDSLRKYQQINSHKSTTIQFRPETTHKKIYFLMK